MTTYPWNLSSWSFVENFGPNEFEDDELSNIEFVICDKDQFFETVDGSPTFPIIWRLYITSAKEEDEGELASGRYGIDND